METHFRRVSNQMQRNGKACEGDSCFVSKSKDAVPARMLILACLSTSSANQPTNNVQEVVINTDWSLLIAVVIKPESNSCKNDSCNCLRITW